MSFMLKKLIPYKNSSNQLVASYAFNAGQPGGNAVYSMKFQWPLLHLFECHAVLRFEVFISFLSAAINWFPKFCINASDVLEYTVIVFC